MKYYYEKQNDWTGAGETYICNHPMFVRATLFRRGEKGLLIIQEHFNEKSKARWWGIVEPWVAGDIYQNENFSELFERNAGKKDENGLYPVMKLRTVMWKLRMKPLKKAYWETF